MKQLERNKSDSFKKFLVRMIKLPFGLLFLLSRFFPKKHDLWVFGSHTGDSFRDNGKYFFLYIANHHPEINAIWITKNKFVLKELKMLGYKVYHKWSLKGIYLCLRAKVVIYDFLLAGINQYAVNGIEVQLWHGLGVKKVGFDNLKRRELLESSGLKGLRNRILYPYLLKKPSWVLAVSPKLVDFHVSAFGIEKDKVLPFGYPRNDVFFENIKGMEIGTDMKLLEVIQQKKREGKKILIYMPTFRDTGDILLEDIFDFDYLNNKLEEMNAVMIVKYHELSTMAKYLQKRGNILTHILVCDPLSDSYPLLPYVDLLISDYSTIFYDFVLLDKPMLFYIYDYDKYVKEDRELYIDLKTTLPGEIVTTFSSLMDKIGLILDKNIDSTKDKRAEMNNFYHPYLDGGYSKKLYAFLEEKLTK